MAATYLGLLGRDADPSGWAFWKNNLENGQTRDVMTSSFITGGEFINFEALYVTNNQWNNAGSAGSPCLRSPNYSIANPNSSASRNAVLVSILHYTTLGRCPDPGGRDYWEGLLNSNLLPPSGVTIGFVTSPEFPISHVGGSGDTNQHRVFSTLKSFGPSGLVLDAQTNVSAATRNLRKYRYEPSTAAGGTWLTSWHDIAETAAGQSPTGEAVGVFTSAWTGTGWSAPIEHRTPTNSMLDAYTGWNPKQSKFMLVALGFPGLGSSIWFRSSTNYTGLDWEPMTVALQGTFMNGNVAWDFPSVAVNANSGRIVVGASKSTPTVEGYFTAYSDDNGAHWFGPYSVNGPVGGSTSRIVWSASGFHAFIVDTSNKPWFVLQHWQSNDGAAWTRQNDIATYGMPLLSSPPGACCGDAQISYAITPDAVSSPGLGWVVEYPVNVGAKNAINVATELGGDVNIYSGATDLFNVGLATSGTGDWYVTYHCCPGHEF